MKKQDFVSAEKFKEIASKHNYDAMKIYDELKEHYSSPNSVYKRIRYMRKHGSMPLDSGNQVSTGERLLGSSTLYDADGNVKLQWVKTDTKSENQIEAFSDAVNAIADQVKDKYEPQQYDVITSDDILTVYTIGDAHIGMMSWHRETQSDHDIQIAEQDLMSAMHMLVKSASESTECLIVDVGDFYHSDNYDNKTAKSGNILDVDGRYPKVLETGLRIIQELITMALTKHQIVRWRSALGNHNTHSAIMISAFVKAYFRLEPRVIVHDSPSVYDYHVFGKNLIGITHGDTTKPDNLGNIMSVDAKEHWSDSEFRYWYLGHVHHQSVKEYNNCVVETFRTLAGKDAWHYGAGYRSGQDMKAITLHKEFGEIGRTTCGLALARQLYKHKQGIV